MANNNVINAPFPFTVPQGGTGAVTWTANQLMLSGTTATGVFQQVSANTLGYVLTDNGVGNAPTFQPATVTPFNYGLSYIIARGIY